METTFVDFYALREAALEEGIEIGLEKGMLATITNAIKNGLEKSEILRFLDCSEELYQKAYGQVHGTS